MSPARPYLFAGVLSEADRLQLQARTWEREVETMLDEIAIVPGWRCIDVGCGSMGVIGPLARRTGPTGRVVAVDRDPVLVDAAGEYAKAQALDNIELRVCDLFTMDLPLHSFDLVHARFLLAPIGRHGDVLDRLTSLVRNGGVIVLEEPDAATWTASPLSESWDALRAVVVRAFERLGGDFNAGAVLGKLLRRTGARPICGREATLTLPAAHPYSGLLLQFARSLRTAIVEHELMSEAEFRRAVLDCERLLQTGDCCTRTFRLVQAWGRLRC